jgi:site-specific recombinase XerD
LEVVRVFCDRLPKTKGITVKFACEKYQDLIEDRRQKRGSTSTYGKSLKHYFTSFTHLYGDRELYEITANEIREWLDVQCFRKSAKTHNNYLKGVRAMYSMAVKRKWVVENVSLEVDFLPVMPTAVGVFAPDTIQKLLQAAHDAGEMDMLLAFALKFRQGGCWQFDRHKCKVVENKEEG